MRASRLHLQDVILIDVHDLGSTPTGNDPTDPPWVHPGGQGRSDPSDPASAERDDRDPPVDPPVDPRADRRRHTHRMRRWWPATAGLVLLLLVVVNTALDSRSERARVAALAGVNGILTPLEGPIAEQWRTGIEPRAGLAESAGVLVGLDRGRDGRVDVVGLDPATGEEMWRREARPAGPIEGWANCAAPDATDPPGPAPVVVCTIADAVVITAETTTGYVYYPTRARLLVIEAETGALLANDPTDPSTRVAPLDDDLVMSRVDGDGRAHITRTDARAAIVRWTFVSPDPIPPNDFRQRIAGVSVVDGLVLVDAGPTWVLASDGEILSSWSPSAGMGLGRRVEVLRDGAIYTEPVEIRDDVVPGSRIVDAADGSAFTTVGYPARMAVDDGSLADLVLVKTTRNSLIAYDIRTGQPRWTTSSTAQSRTMIISGRLLRTEAGELQSIEGKTGALVWATPVERAAESPLLTDGHVVLLTRHDADRGLVLDAYGLDDGRLRWGTDIADDLQLFALDQGLYGWSENGVARLS